MDSDTESATHVPTGKQIELSTGRPPPFRMVAPDAADAELWRSRLRQAIAAAELGQAASPDLVADLASVTAAQRVELVDDGQFDPTPPDHDDRPREAFMPRECDQAPVWLAGDRQQREDEEGAAQGKEQKAQNFDNHGYHHQHNDDDDDDDDTSLTPPLSSPALSPAPSATFTDWCCSRDATWIRVDTGDKSRFAPPITGIVLVSVVLAVDKSAHVPALLP